MRRESRSPRPDSKEKLEHLGLVFHTVDDQPYWYEGAAYVFESSEIETLEKATNDLHEMCLDAVEHVIRHDLYERLSIPESAQPLIKSAWDNDPPAIYGRFDLSFDGSNPPKMLEFNADTPTSLLEAAVIQWHWLQEVMPELDQFNSIWDGLIEKWKALKAEGLVETRVDFACVDHPEDIMTTAVMMDTAAEAGIDVNFLYMADIGWDSLKGKFVNQHALPITSIFKLYPWEWILNDEFGKHVLATYGQVAWIEPIWKMILSNKAILPILWELFPDHPNLLPAYADSPRDMSTFVCKPILGREGANVRIVRNGETISNDGPYNEQPMVYQAYSPLPEFDRNHAVIGSWVVDCTARGIGIRESNGPITEDLARFVPHYFKPESNIES